MKMNKLRKRLGLVAIILLWTAGIPQASPPSEFEARKIRFSNDAVLSTALIAMMEVEGSLPKSLEDLCQTPYVAIRCTDLINPYARRPIKNLKDSPGDFYFDFSNGWLKVYYYYLWNGKVQTGVADKKYLEDLKKQREDFLRLGVWDPALAVSKMDFKSKAAYAVGRFLKSVLWNFETEPPDFKLPPSFSELFLKSVTEVRPENPRSVNFSRDLLHLRNEFTGGYARLTETPSPGDFYYGPWKENPGKYLYLVTYGEGGKVVFDLLYDLTEKVTKVYIPSPYVSNGH